jgi:glycosyltransferase involved in cell wall biosynthesis
MTQTVPVSVVIPAYNRAPYLARALRSVLSQTRPPAEVIVVDDGSKDNTAQVVREFAPAVRYFYQDNAGVSNARNRGIREAKEEWIAFLDSDDEWYPHKLETQFDILGQYPHLRWCACNFHIVTGNHVRESGPGFRNRRELARYGFFPNALRAARRDVLFHTSGVVIHRTVFDRVGGFDPAMSIAEDNDLWWRIALAFPTAGYDIRPCHRYYLETVGNLYLDDKLTQMVFSSLAKNLAQAHDGPPDVCRAFLRLAQGISFRRLAYCCAHPEKVPEGEVEKFLHLFPPSLPARLILGTIKRLPSSLSRRLEGYVRDLHRAWSHWR